MDYGRMAEFFWLVDLRRGDLSPKIRVILSTTFDVLDPAAPFFGGDWWRVA